MDFENKQKKYTSISECILDLKGKKDHLVLAIILGTCVNCASHYSLLNCLFCTCFS